MHTYRKLRHTAVMMSQVMLLRCLIVDDSRHFLEAARNLLERQGISVVGVASSGAEALRRVEELAPDVVLADIDLGAENGFELARRLGRSVPVILISTHAQQDFADMIAESPAVGFLPKSELSSHAIRDLLRGGGTERISATRGR
jgi:DNA-binding NarL/FixJ family response regulator